MVLRAGRYVLACGGLESTRLLLASHRDGDGGIGNHAGHLGRWYMAHVESRIADVHFTTDPAATVAGHERDDAGVYVRRRFTLSPEAQRREGLPNVALWLVNPRLSDAAHRNGFLSLVYLLLRSPIGGRFVADAIRQSHLRVPTSSTVRDHVDNVVREMAGSLRAAGRFAYERFLRRGRKLPGFSMRSDENRYPILYHAEHLPSWHSYVELSDVRDEVGMPRLATHLAFAEADVAAVERVHRLLDASLRSQGLGHVEFLYDDVAAAVRRGVFGGRHQIGTTRMSALPEDGVVDGDLAVHGHDDLFVLASSVFPTSSQANPTLMLVAMALRLAAHLDARAAAPAAGERSGHLARAA
jgi:choline dehydrogenase-like flavoprotein